MKRLVLYLVRMVVFVSIWVAIVSSWEHSSPKEKLPTGVLAWLLSEVLINAWDRFTRDKKKGS